MHFFLSRKIFCFSEELGLFKGGENYSFHCIVINSSRKKEVIDISRAERNVFNNENIKSRKKLWEKKVKERTQEKCGERGCINTGL